MSRNKGNKPLIGRFETLADFVDAAENGRQVNAANASHTAHHMEANRAEWYGIDNAPTLPEVAAVVRSGWQDGAARTARASDALDVPRVPSIRRRRIRGDHGDAIDIDRVYSGALDTAWSRVARAECSAPPRVLIAVDSIAIAYQRAEAMFWKGAAATALADALTAAGYAVKCISAFEGNNYGHRVSCRVTCKDYRAPWDLATAAASLALPGFFRALGHAWYTRHATWECGPGMTVLTLTEKHLRDDGDVDASHVFIAHQLITNKNEAIAWIRKCIARLNNAGAEAIAA